MLPSSSPTDFDVQALIWNGEKSVRDDFPGLRGSAGRRILNALFAEEWRIVHVASHGQFNPLDSSRSGVVIDSDVYITPNIVRQLPVVPELVFVNCCYLGQLADSRTGPRDPNRLAASVARELMRIGVRAVVAAGWAVDDEPAGDFACAFYAELLAGRLLGEAVHAARRRVHQAPSCFDDVGCLPVLWRSEFPPARGRPLRRSRAPERRRARRRRRRRPAPLRQRRRPAPVRQRGRARPARANSPRARRQDRPSYL